jgi:hypothetical protein
MGRGEIGQADTAVLAAGDDPQLQVLGGRTDPQLLAELSRGLAGLGVVIALSSDAVRHAELPRRGQA